MHRRYGINVREDLVEARTTEFAMPGVIMFYILLLVPREESTKLFNLDGRHAFSR